MLPGIQILKRVHHSDERGYFTETWKITQDSMLGDFRQLNTAYSTHKVLRGLHKQDQTKLVMPLVGKIFDVAVDTDTGEYFGIELDNQTSLLIPPQYAHGYLVLSEYALVQYIVDKPYDKMLEKNYNWNSFNINWPIKEGLVLSDKDR